MPPSTFSQLQRQVILDLLLCQLPKTRLDPPSHRSDSIIRTRYAHDPDLNRPFRHLAFEPFFEGEEGGVDGILERDIVVVSVPPIQ